MNPNSLNLSPLADLLITELDKKHEEISEDKISVNPVVAEVATWYEKLRNAMVYKEEEVILRTAIERILNRRLILGGTGETIAGPLIRELVWARYFPDSSVPATLVTQVSTKIDLYLRLQTRIIERLNFNRSVVFEWMLQLLSCEVEKILSPKKDKELISNFMFHKFRDKVVITDDSEETRDAQVFIAVRRAFGKEDLALLRFLLFSQYFNELTDSNLENISEKFPVLIKKIEKQLKYSLRDRIYSYIKNQTPPFFVLEDIFKKNRGNIRSIFSNSEQFQAKVLETCNGKYKEIISKVQRAIIRSVIFIFVTKIIFALAIETSFESFFYGRVYWFSISINTLISPLLMIIAGSFIQTPGRENAKRILELINAIIFTPNPSLSKKLVLERKPKNTRPLLNFSFSLLWVLALLLGLWAIRFTLSKLHFNLVSQGVFIFFLTIVSFLAYRINQTAKIYTVSQEKQNLGSILFDFFFMPFIQLGRHLTLGMSQLNIVLFIFDFIIEAPFKGIFAFFEHWFLYLKTQRESLE